MRLRRQFDSEKSSSTNFQIQLIKYVIKKCKVYILNVTYTIVKVRHPYYINGSHTLFGVESRYFLLKAIRYIGNMVKTEQKKATEKGQRKIGQRENWATENGQR